MMDRRTDQRNWERPAVGPQSPPVPPVHRLQEDLARANELIVNMEKHMADMKRKSSMAMRKDKGRIASLEERLKKTCETLSQKDAEIALLKQSVTPNSSVEEWRSKYNALEAKLVEEQAEKKSWMAQRARIHKRVKHMQTNLDQKDALIQQLSEDYESLSQELDSSQSWEEPIYAEDQEQVDTEDDDIISENESLSLKLAETTDLLSQKETQFLDTISENESLSVKLAETINLLRQRDTAMLNLIKENESLSEELAETSNLLSGKDAGLQQSDAWRKKCIALEDQWTKNQAEKQQHWETLQLDFQQKVKQRDSEILDVVKETQSLSQKLMDATNLYTKNLAEKQHGWEATENQLQHEKKELQDICMTLKTESRGFFSRRRVVDREATLQKLKEKLQKKAEK